MATVQMYNSESAPLSPYYLHVREVCANTHIERKVHNRRAKKLKKRGEEIFIDFVHERFVWFMKK